MNSIGVVALKEKRSPVKWTWDGKQHPPVDLTFYPHQVGGHGAYGKESGIRYSINGAILYKPVQKYPKGLHEVQLYRQVFAADCADPTLLELRSFLPMCEGLYRDPLTTKTYLCLKDVLVGIRRPAVCDIKMGRLTYSPDAPIEKIAVEQSKYKWQTDLGFCITGMKVYHPVSKTPIYLDRYYGRSLSPDTVYEHGVRLFLGPDPARSRHLARAFVCRLNQLLGWFERQCKLSFYASSLLLAYESDSSNGLVTLDTFNEHVVAYLIDFTRWRPSFGGARDENFLFGLRRFIDLLQRASTDTDLLLVPGVTQHSGAVNTIAVCYRP